MRMKEWRNEGMKDAWKKKRKKRRKDVRKKEMDG